MDYVDLQRRRENRARSRRTPEVSGPSILRDPLFLLGTGFVLGFAAASFFFGGQVTPGLTILLPSVATVVLLVYALWLLVRKNPAQNVPKLGSEKQLLLAILDAGGGMTPVEAALETSLTVDEAEEILTRFADRGHLVVESRDGALFYTIPGRRGPDTQAL